MLVLTRKTNEQIVIGENIVITLVQIRRGTVRLGIEAPKSVPVHRKEVYDALSNERAAASGRCKSREALGAHSR